jgi:RNA polymerase sigma-70 factor (ECF subfamily)
LHVLHRVARSWTGQSADAEDLVQDTLLRAFMAIDGFDGSHPRAWLLTILRNVARTWHRHRPLVFPHDAENDPVSGGQLDPSAEQLVVEGTFTSDVERALCSLPTTQRQILLLVAVQGLNYVEAAEHLGLPLGTVTSRLHRARHRMRRQLQCSDSTANET